MKKINNESFSNFRRIMIFKYYKIIFHYIKIFFIKYTNYNNINLNQKYTLISIKNNNKNNFIC